MSERRRRVRRICSTSADQDSRCNLEQRGDQNEETGFRGRSRVRRIPKGEDHDRPDRQAAQQYPEPPAAASSRLPLIRGLGHAERLLVSVDAVVFFVACKARLRRLVYRRQAPMVRAESTSG